MTHSPAERTCTRGLNENHTTESLSHPVEPGEKIFFLNVISDTKFGDSILPAKGNWNRHNVVEGLVQDHEILILAEQGFKPRPVCSRDCTFEYDFTLPLVSDENCNTQWRGQKQERKKYQALVAVGITWEDM